MGKITVQHITTTPKFPNGRRANLLRTVCMRTQMTKPSKTRGTRPTTTVTRSTYLITTTVMTTNTF